MDSQQRAVIDIVYSAFTGEKISLPNDFDFSNGVKIAKRHKIEVMFYYGALNCGFEKNASMRELFMPVSVNIAADEQQVFSVKELFAAFDEQKIDYMPLKGVLLKNIYPKSEMRSMSDADILIKTEQYDKIRAVMLKLGYNAVLESDHELVWNRNSISIELHKRLIPSYNKDYYSYFGDGWRLAKVKNGTAYSMTDEDQLIYLFTHFAKHYRDGGIGIKHMTDLWVYRKSKPNLDEKYIKNELTALQLFDFYVNIKNTLSVWFDGKKEDPKTDFITDVIFNSGVYGTRDKHAVSDAVKLSKSTDKVKTKKVFKLLFPSCRVLSVKYPCLKKAPFLLPFVWIYRIFTTVLFRSDKVKKQAQAIDKMNADNINDYRQSLNYVGLDFNFKE